MFSECKPFFMPTTCFTRACVCARAMSCALLCVLSLGLADSAQTLRGSWLSRSPAFPISKASPTTKHHQVASQANGNIGQQGPGMETGLSLAVAQILINPLPPVSVTSASRPDWRPLRMHPSFIVPGMS